MAESTRGRRQVVAAAAELEDKVRRYPNTRQSTLARRLFVRSLKQRRKSLPEGLRVHTLEDIYGGDSH